MGGVKGKTGTYARTPEMLANYGRAARNRKYTADGRQKISARYARMLAAGQHPCQGKNWKLTEKAVLARRGKPGNNLGHRHTEATKELCRLGSIKGRLKQANRKGPTVIEATVYRYLETTGVAFYRQFSLGGGYIADAFLPTLLLVIEVDGTYWHSSPEAKVKDARKDKFIVGAGLSVLRIPESQVDDNSFELLIDRALKARTAA